MKLPTIATLLFALLTSLAAAPSLAASYIKFDGIDGEATDKAHRGWIDLLSTSHTAQRDAASGMASGKRQHKPITVIKRIDKSSPSLMNVLSDGSIITNVKLRVDGHVTVLKRAEVISIKQDGTGNEVLVLRATDHNTTRSNRHTRHLDQDDDCDGLSASKCAKKKAKKKNKTSGNGVDDDCDASIDDACSAARDYNSSRSNKTSRRVETRGWDPDKKNSDD